MAQTVTVSASRIPAFQYMYPPAIVCWWLRFWIDMFGKSNDEAAKMGELGGYSPPPYFDNPEMESRWNEGWGSAFLPTYRR